MTRPSVDIKATLDEVEKLLQLEPALSPALVAAIRLLMSLVILLTGQLGLNSKNSSKPPASDPHRDKKSRAKSQAKPGGQPGHDGSTLEKFATPDEIRLLKIDRRTLPHGHQYADAGYESRQVIDMKISTVVTEYRAQVLINEQGKRYVADFPDGITRPIQYGSGIKSHAVYMSQFQLIPYLRVQNHFDDQLGIFLSCGSLFNFNQEAFNALENYEQIAKQQLAQAEVLHVDETGINMNGKGHWLHVASNEDWTHYAFHKKRGCVAMDDIGILPQFNGILCHDHWKPYYTYACAHSLCNAHHLRELERAWEQDGQQWALDLKTCLLQLDQRVKEAGGVLCAPDIEQYQTEYRAILARGEKESPPPDTDQPKGKRGRIKNTKSRNLLVRLRTFEADVLRFMVDARVPFTNNQAENDLRMTKVQQKISGCFRSEDGANMFCRIRGFLSTCRKHGITASDALYGLFEGRLPDFVSKITEANEGAE